MTEEQVLTVVKTILNKNLTIEELVEVCTNNNAEVDDANNLIETVLTMTDDARL